MCFPFGASVLRPEWLALRNPLGVKPKKNLVFLALSQAAIFYIQAPEDSMTKQSFTNACTVGHAYPVDYFHGISSKTTAYIRNNATLNVLLGLSKRTSKTFFVALAKTYAGYCFAVNIYYSFKLKLQVTMDRILPFLTMSAQSRFSALPQLRHSPNFPYWCNSFYAIKLSFFVGKITRHCASNGYSRFLIKQ